MSTIKLAGDGTVSYIISFDKFGLLLRFKKKGPGSPKSVICVRVASCRRNLISVDVYRKAGTHNSGLCNVRIPIYICCGNVRKS
jgi:hypothetical protein